MTETKVVIVGGAGVGKTSFVKRHINGCFTPKYIPTVGVEVSTLRLNTSKGPVKFHMWDTAGQDMYAGLADGYYIGAQFAIVIFSLDSKESLKEAGKYIGRVRRVCEEVPMVLCGNKSDETNRRVTKEDIVMFLAKYKGLKYYSISARNHSNLSEPIFHAINCSLGEETEILEADIGDVEEAKVEDCNLPLPSEEEVAEGSGLLYWIKSWF